MVATVKNELLAINVVRFTTHKSANVACNKSGCCRMYRVQNLYERFPDGKANLFRNVTRELGVTPELFYPIGSQYPQYTTYRNLICCKTGLNRE